MKPYFEDDRASIFHADTFKLMETMKENIVDLILTSPRYNGNIDYDGEIDDFSPPMEYVDEMKEFFRLSYKVLKNGGHLAIVMPFYMFSNPDDNWDGTYKVEPYLAHIISWVWEEWHHNKVDNPLWYIGSIPWVKPHMSPRMAVVGSRYNKPALSSRWELISFFRKGHENRNNETGDPPDNEFMKHHTSPWMMSGETSNKKLGHPVPYPEELVRRVIRSFAREGEVVFDPFMGSGTTGKVALRMNRYFIGCDVVEKYVKKSMSRMMLDHKQVW